MGTHDAEVWINGALTALLLGLVVLVARSCRTESDCDCQYGPPCGECVIYDDPLPLQKEPQTYLADLYWYERSYFWTYKTFATTFTAMSWPVREHRYYAYFLPDEVIQPDITEPYSLPPGLSPAADSSGFTAVAVGNIDCDTVLDIWTVNDAQVIVNVVNDLSE